MSSLQNNNINTTYDSLLKFVDNDGLANGQKLVTDGLGTSTALTLGQLGAGARITGNINSTESITADINITAGGNLTVSGVTRLNGDTIVDGDLQTLSNISAADFTFTGSGSVAGNLSVSNGTLNVGGFTTLENNTTIGGSLDVEGPATIGSSLDVIGNTTIGGNIAIGGNTTIGGQLNVNGDITAFSTSDRRKKDNIKPLNVQPVFDGITGYEFDWNEKSSLSGKSYGFIAQDVQKVLPELVKECDDGYLAVDYIKIIPFLFEKVKQLTEEVNKLKQQ